VTLVGALLFLFGLLFAFQSLSEIVLAMFSGTAPKGIDNTGLPVNPVHLLDLAFVLPGMIVTAMAVHRRKPLGLLFAAANVLGGVGDRDTCADKGSKVRVNYAPMTVPAKSSNGPNRCPGDDCPSASIA